jgi:hypothetical protein
VDPYFFAVTYGLRGLTDVQEGVDGPPAQAHAPAVVGTRSSEHVSDPRLPNPGCLAVWTNHAMTYKRAAVVPLAVRGASRTSPTIQRTSFTRISPLWRANASRLWLSRRNRSASAGVIVQARRTRSHRARGHASRRTATNIGHHANRTVGMRPSLRCAVVVCESLRAAGGVPTPPRLHSRLGVFPLRETDSCSQPDDGRMIMVPVIPNRL